MTESKRPIGFLSPYGEYIACDMYEHISVARDICRANGWSDYGNHEDILLQHGYAHMTLSLLGKKEYHVYWEHFLTAEQKHWLQPIFEIEDDKDIIPISPITRYEFEEELKI